MLDENGEPVRIPGMLKHVKAIGWYVEEYGMAQVSMNLTNIDETPLHAAFDACSEAAAQARTARHRFRSRRHAAKEMSGGGRADIFCANRNGPRAPSEEELIDLAIRSMGLSELKPFDPKEKVIEFKIEAATAKSLVKMNLRQFCNETLSDSPAPGGGSVAALMGALGRIARRNGGESLRRETRLG